MVAWFLVACYEFELLCVSFLNNYSLNIMQAWAHLCKCLGQDFFPYMSIVMPPLLHSTQLKLDVTITNVDDVVDERIDSHDDMHALYDYFSINWNQNVH